ncbi:phage major capsid protein [Caulifigura coniformis]|uniref:phage major capsid protein n=1 Tax=Caulifigura coniformis TaxID=2527983 RepID=UPI0011A45CF8|nr:hypothetical protein [Caulifigura coniformis]
MPRKLPGVLVATSDLPSLFICDSGEAITVTAAAGDEKGPPTCKLAGYTGGLMRPRGWGQNVVIDLATLRLTGQVIPLLRDHDTQRIVGHSTAVTNDGRKVDVLGTVSGVGGDAHEVKETSRQGFPWQSSVGVDLTEAKTTFIAEGQKLSANGRNFKGPFHFVQHGLLRETSFVVFGGDPKTSATVKAVAQPQGRDEMNFDKWLQALGFDVATLTDDQKKTLKASFDQEQAAAETALPGRKKKGEKTPTSVKAKRQDDDEDEDEDDDEQAHPTSRHRRRGVQASADDDDALTAQRKTLAADVNRVAGIRELCAQFENPTFKVQNATVLLEAHAIEQGWDLAKTELECRRESRPAAPAAHGKSKDDGISLQAMEGAIILTAGGQIDQVLRSRGDVQAPTWMTRPVNDENRQRVMEASHRFSDMTMMDVARECARMDGTLKAFGRKDILEAAFSGSTLTKIFTSSINARVLARFEQIGDSTMGWCGEAEHADFKVNDVIGLKRGAQGMKKLPRGGTAGDATFEDKGEGYRVHRYAEKYEIDEQDMIDDRMDLFKSIPDDISEQAARLRPDLVYAILLSNPAMADGTAIFHTNRGNVGTSKALDETNLKAAFGTFRTRTENGVTLDLQPTHLVTAADLEFTADGLINSVETRGSSGAGPTKNTLAKKVREVLSDGRIDNGVTDPNSGATVAGNATAWFIFCDRQPVVEVAYLRGTGRAPRIRRYTLDKGKYGIGWDCSMDVGAKGIRSTGYKATN